ncbi:hypothetical protein Dimus_008493 [Dionaea muscipula]
MGLRWWKKGDENPDPKPPSSSQPQTPSPQQQQQPEVPGMNGAVEVPRSATEVTVFEFGSVATSTDKVTLAGYCPVSEDLEPCRWQILPVKDSDAPQFRVAF